MSIKNGPVAGELGRAVGFRARLFEQRLMLIAIVVVMLGLVLMTDLPLAFGLIGAALLSAITLFPRPAAMNPITPSAQTGIDAGALRTLVEGLPNPVFALNRDGLVLASNSAARAAISGLRDGESALLVLRSPDLLDAVRSCVAKLQPNVIQMYERVPMDRWYETSLIPVRHEDDSITIIVSLSDQTLLHRADAMRSDFVANASHELRTPLAALTGFIETLQGPAKNDVPAQERFLAIMHVQALRMARLIDDLLSLSRVELAEHIRPQNPIEITAIIRQVLDGLQVLAKERHVEVAVTGGGTPLLVLGDRDELIGAFENLIENALKYGSSGRRVEIVLSTETSGGDHNAIVVVRDFGPGIPAEHLPRLTERFYRVDVGQSRAEGGTGLGLALVKHIVNRHRGQLSIRSVLGHGASFIVKIPLHAGRTA